MRNLLLNFRSELLVIFLAASSLALLLYVALPVFKRIQRPSKIKVNVLVASVAVMMAAVCGALKPGRQQQSRSTIPMSGASSGETVAAEDVARGYAVSFVVTNSAPCEAPTNMTLVGKWHLRGAYRDWLRLDMDGFEFPFGTDTVSRLTSCSVFTDGKIRPTPRDTGKEISAVGAPMLAVQGISRFGVAPTESGGLLLAWNEFFLGADTNSQINAQIELFPDGDFIVRSNEVETVCRRIEPFDWDGDGLSNEVDAFPLRYDGDFHGEVKNLPEGADEDLYYYLTLCVDGPQRCAEIRVTCDGPSDLGNHVIVANTKQECRIPLLAGASYSVETTLPIINVGVSTDLVEIVTNSVTRLTVTLPVFFSLSEQSPGAGSELEMLLGSSPVELNATLASVDGGCCNCVLNNHGFVWTCHEGCSCGGYVHRLTGIAAWEGYSKSFQCDASCACQRNRRDNPSCWFDVNSPSVIFLGATNHISNLSIGFDPPEAVGGELALRCVSGLDRFRLRSPSGEIVSLPCRWNAEMFSGAIFEVEGMAVSASANDIVFELSYENSELGSYTNFAAMTVARVDRVQMTSPVSGVSGNPPPFEGESLCPFYPESRPYPDKHLMIPFCNVAHVSNGFSVVDFDVDMTVELRPSDTPTSGVFPLWSLLPETPDSGVLIADAGLSATFRNPKLGGVYRFSVTCNGSPATECNLVLPLSGAEVTGVIEEDIVDADLMISNLLIHTSSLERQSPFWGLKYFNDKGMGDYRGRVDNENSRTIWNYNQVNDLSGLGAVATWHGVPIRMAKASNFLVGYETKRLDVWELFRQLSQNIGTANDETAEMSWNAGTDVAMGTNFTFATAQLVTNAWALADDKVKRLWPNNMPTDNLAYPAPMLDYDLVFRSPGFVEKGRELK